MQREYDLQQQMLSSNGGAESQENRSRNGDEEEAVIENDGSIEFQNLGFQCSCTSVNREDIPPSYLEVSSSNTSSGEGENENDVCNNNTQQPQQTNNNHIGNVSVNHVETGNVDLDKEEEV